MRLNTPKWLQKENQTMEFGKTKLGLLAFAGAFAMGSVANAASITSLTEFSGDVGGGVGTFNSASDDDIERLIVDLNKDGLLDVGDVVEGYLNMNNLNGTNIGGGTANSEWSAMFRIEVTGKLEVGGPGSGVFQMTFGPTSTWAEADAFLGTTGNTKNAMVLFWEDSTPDIDLTSTAGVDATPTTATNGAEFWALGFTDPAAASHVSGGSIVSTNGEGWVSDPGSDDFSLGLAVSVGSEIGASNFGVNRVSTDGIAGGWLLEEQDLGPITSLLLGGSSTDSVEFIGSSSVRGVIGSKAEGSTFGATSNTDFAFKAIATPLPAAALPGLAMLGGMGVFASRRRK